MTREEAFNYLKENSSNTQNGLMVHICHVEKAIKAVSDDEELIEKALDGIYECEGNCADWMEIGDAKWFVDVALGIEGNTYFN